MNVIQKAQGWLTFFFWVLFISLSLTIYNSDDLLQYFAPLGYLGLFLASALNGATLVIGGPSQVLTFLMAGNLQPMLLGLVGGTGTAIGETTGYLLGKSTNLALSRQSESLITYFRKSKLFKVFKKHPAVILAVLALIPNPFFDPVSILAGSLGISFRTYFFPVLVGKIARFTLIAFIGSYYLQ